MREKAEWVSEPGMTDSQSSISLRANSVIHRHQEQTSRRRCWPGLRTRTGRQNCRDGGFLQIPSPYFKKRADQIAHHMVQKAISLDPVKQQRRLLNPAGSLQAPHI